MCALAGFCNPEGRLLLISPHRTEPPTRYAHDDGDARDGAAERSLISTLTAARRIVNCCVIDGTVGCVVPASRNLQQVKRAPSKTLSSPPSARKPPKPASILAIKFPKTWHSYPTQPAKLEVDPNPPSPANAGPSPLTAESARYDFHKSNPKPVPFKTLSPKVSGGRAPHLTNKTRRNISMMPIGNHGYVEVLIRLDRRILRRWSGVQARSA